ncbi:hypothetical protein PTT_19227 [Pyrenophora teres f. teres 0-1]|uniref:Uncharacterized protein n=1 Tax=Pyrenophora teres f. teres (strain 0-1) TaxID=861557 RepID=E3S8G3_PYRTT|nr:hypothetical protein PTT_19227 [Pyrenophora teres f. teres 0-1]
MQFITFLILLVASACEAAHCETHEEYHGGICGHDLQGKAHCGFIIDPPLSCSTGITFGYGTGYDVQ